MNEPTAIPGNPIFSKELQKALEEKTLLIEKEMPIPTEPATEELVAFVNGMTNAQFNCFIYLTDRFAAVGQQEVLAAIEGQLMQMVPTTGAKH